MITLELDLPELSVAFVLTLASARDHAQNWLFESSTLIGQYSWHVTFRKHPQAEINIPQPDNFHLILHLTVQTLLCPDKVAVQTIVSQQRDLHWAACGNVQHLGVVTTSRVKSV